MSLTRNIHFFVRSGRFAALYAVMAMGAAVVLGAAEPDFNASDVLNQVKANQVAIDTLYQKIEVIPDAGASTISAGANAGRKVIETWAFTEPSTGRRMVKFFVNSQFSLMYRIDLDTFELEMLTGDGNIRRTPQSPETQAMLKAALKPMTGADEDLLASNQVDLIPEKDRDGAELGTPLVSEGQEDSAGEAYNPSDPNPPFMPRKQGGFSGLFAKKKEFRHKRGKFKTWHGKRVRAIKLSPRTTSGKAHGWEERDIDLGNGINVGSRKFSAEGKLIQEDKVVATRANDVGGVDVAETETSYRDSVGHSKRQRTLIHALKKNQPISQVEMDLKPAKAGGGIP